MDRKYNQDDEFEQFLQDELAQHRMFPADHVWNNIRTELHGNPSWHALTVISLLIIISLTVSTLLIAPSSSKFQFNPLASIPKKKAAIVDATSLHAPIAQEAYFNKIEPQHLTQATVALVNNVLNTDVDAEAKQFTPFDEPSAILPSLTDQNNQTDKTIYSTISKPTLSDRDYPRTIIAETMNAKPATEKMNVIPTKKISAIPHLMSIQNGKINEGKTIHKNAALAKKSKIIYQFYITPSKSYRELSDDAVKDIIQPNTVSNLATQNIPLALSYSADVNDIVRHRPAVGLEIGVAALYSITKRLQLKTGIQLNIRQYNIETFQTLTPHLTTVSLLNNSGIENINLFSSYSNNTGYKAAQLENKTYQISVPIGMQLDILKGKQIGVNIEASVQPTLDLNTNTYLLSTDFKNYTDGNGLLRKWNINTSVGINFSLKLGASLWQIGPQIRYQHLPTYSNRYPIKEQLVDYGIRLAFTR